MYVIDKPPYAEEAFVGEFINGICDYNAVRLKHVSV